MHTNTLFFTWLHGKRVGADAEGNVYYEERRARPGLRRRRWVVYHGGPVEASRVPPEWHAWLHYTTDAPLLDVPRHPWQRPHQPNLTGTPQAYRPSGHDYQGGKRAAASGDYEAWTPGS
jgi:NADH:ubiquinone oxidoreductase subunit